MIDKRPALIARCKNVNDIARTSASRVTATCTRQYRGGLASVDDGVVCDLSLFPEHAPWIPNAAPVRRRRLPVGTRWTQPHGLAVPAGSSRPPASQV